MNDACVPFLVIGGIILLIAALVSPIFIVAGVNSKKRKKFQKHIIQSKGDLLKRGKYFPVRYASSKKFHRWFKFFPWETTGILFIHDKGLTFYAHKFEGQEETEVHFRRGDYKVNWLGTEDFLRNGATSWIEIKVMETKHFFTSETGVTIFDSGSSTRYIYDELTQVNQQ